MKKVAAPETESEDSDSDSDSDSENDEDTPNTDLPNVEPKKLYVHEEVARKGHGGSAELGPPVPLEPKVHEKDEKKKGKKVKKYYWQWEDVDKMPLVFVFHYGPKGE
jgi:hypothetical protein